MSCRGWSSDAWAAVSLTLGLQELGHSVVLVCRKGVGENVAKRALDIGVRHVRFLSFKTGIAPKTWIRDVRGIIDLCNQYQAQIFHAHRGQDHWLAAATRCLITRTHSHPPILIRSRHILQPVRTHWPNRWLYNHATTQTGTATDIIQRGFTKTRAFRKSQFVTLRGGVDTREFRPDLERNTVRTQFKISEKDIVFGMSSSFIPLKGHMNALNALAQLRHDRGLSVHLLMAGSGGDQRKVALRAGELGISNAVHFLGFCKNLPAALSAADVGLFAARSSEGTSRVILEWMALGKPVVATDVGAVREILKNDTEGLIVPPENSSALADTMERILLDSDLRCRMGAASRKRAESEYDRLVWARKWVSLYRKASGLKRVTIDDPVPTSGITESTS